MNEFIRQEITSWHEELKSTFLLYSDIKTLYNDDLKSLYSAMQATAGENHATHHYGNFRFCFKNPETGKVDNIGAVNQDLTARYRFAKNAKNRHYQWLLVEAYETFLERLRRIYAQLGFTKLLSWKSYERARLPSKRPLTLDDYLEIAKCIKIDQLLNNFDSSLGPGFQRDLNQNELKINLKFAVLLIAELRHRAVHNRGLLGDRDSFITSVVDKAGINGPMRTDCTFLMEELLSVQDGQDFILLDEAPHTISFVTESYMDRLMGYLISYIYLVEKHAPT